MHTRLQKGGANLQSLEQCGCFKYRQQCLKAFKMASKLHTRKDDTPTQNFVSCASQSTGQQTADKWIEKTLNMIYHAPTNGRVNGHQQECLKVLETQRMPTIRNEEYRFTDISLLLRTDPQLASGEVSEEEVRQRNLGKDVDEITLVVVNGHFSKKLSKIGDLPQGCFIGLLGNAPTNIAQKLGQQARTRGGPFAILNGALSEEILCIALEDGVELEKPIHILHFNTGRNDSEALQIANSRLLVNLKNRSSCQVIEEFSAPDSGAQRFTNSVTEIFLEEEAHLKHKYAELEGEQTWHMKASLVTQAEKSNYQLTEAQLGGKFTRHDLSIQQTGPDTETTMKAFLLCGPSQLHDLHSKLKLEHPRGVASQLHKCIVSASSGKGVFDGNVKVERFAQQTDAAQLSRNILLSPKATVNVKPNLQIIADDVKCSHGCAVSDLEDEQLFYFRTRGIDYATARQVLVYSFGAEVTNDFKYETLLARIQSYINGTLAKAPLS